MSTRFQGRLTVGPDPSPRATGEGIVKVYQYRTINRDATLTQEVTFEIPIGSIITDIVPDVLTQYDSATSATLTVGSASAGTQYAGSVNAKSAGRQLPTFTSAQLTNGNGITGATVYATITSVGQPTVGSVRVLIGYIPPSN